MEIERQRVSRRNGERESSLEWKAMPIFFLFLFPLWRSLIVYFFLSFSWCLCVCMYGSHWGKEYKVLISVLSWVPLQIRIVCITNEYESCGITFPLLFCKCCYCALWKLLYIYIYIPQCYYTITRVSWLCSHSLHETKSIYLSI